MNARGAGSGNDWAVRLAQLPIQRLRYHRAWPSDRRTPWTMPSPTNQW